MLLSLRTTRIIGALLVVALVAACNTVRFAYNQAPQLAYWWIDGYVDANDDQAPRVREAIERWFRWHRQDQLPRYAELLRQAQAHAAGPVAADTVCRWVAQGRGFYEAAFDAAAPSLIDFALTLTPDQLRHIDKRIARSNKDFRKRYLQDDPAERREALYQRTLERAESLYGRLDDSQREWLAQRLAATPFDPERWLAERRARQQDVMQTLHAVVAGRAQMPVAEAQQRLVQLQQRLRASPRADYLRYRETVTADQCELAAQLHARTTTAQRQHARDKLRGWEEDLRALAANGVG